MREIFTMRTGRHPHCQLRGTVVALLLFLPFNLANAAAPYCALRDPSHQIYEMYPEATSYRSVVRDVDEQTRALVGENIPFKLLGHELGQHTIYVPVVGVMPLGIVHVRSESSEWGLVEIAWALSTDMVVTDFRYQRCRGNVCDAVLEKGLRELLRNKDQEALQQLLDSTGMNMERGLLDLSTAEHELASATLRSAIKTIAVTSNAWNATLLELRATVETP